MLFGNLSNNNKLLQHIGKGIDNNLLSQLTNVNQYTNHSDRESNEIVSESQLRTDYLIPYDTDGQKMDSELLYKFNEKANFAMNSNKPLKSLIALSSTKFSIIDQTIVNKYQNCNKFILSSEMKNKIIDEDESSEEKLSSMNIEEHEHLFTFENYHARKEYKSSDFEKYGRSDIVFKTILRKFRKQYLNEFNRMTNYNKVKRNRSP